MTGQGRRKLRGLEGRSVHLSLSDGSRLDDVPLMSAWSTMLWVFTDGQDTFLPIDDVVDFWESIPRRSAA